MANSVSLVVLGLFTFSISSCFSLERLYISKYLSISSKLSILLAHNCVEWSLMTLCISAMLFVTFLAFLILLIWALSFLSWWVLLKVYQFCLSFQRNSFYFHWSFSFFFFFFFFFWPCLGHQKFLGQGWNPSHSSDPRDIRDNTRSLTHQANRELLSLFFLVSISFISALIFVISFLLLNLGFVCSSFPSSFRWKVRLFVSDFSDFLRWTYMRFFVVVSFLSELVSLYISLLELLLWYPIDLGFFFCFLVCFVLFFGCPMAHGVLGPGIRSELSFSLRCGNARSLTHCVRPGIKPVSQHS